jgi:hypothetical protein
MVAVDPVSLDFGPVYLSLSNTLQLTVSNPGTETLQVSGISSDDPEFTVDLAVFDVEPLQSQVVNVTFSAVTSGAHDAALSITHNADGSPTEVPMSAVGVVPPEVAWNPASLEGAAMPGGQKVKTLEICNEGGSDLVFSLGAAENTGVSVPQYDSGGELPKEAEDPRPGILGSGGPDAFGYTWVDSDDPAGPMFDWVDITGVGTPVFGAYSDDGNRGAFPIGFDFPFYGEAFNEFRICSNGWISFTSTRTTYTNQPLPNSSFSVPENLLAVFWDDMVVDPNDGNEVYYYNDGDRLIVQYEIRRIATGGNPPFYSVQAILYPNGNIVYQYAGLGVNQTSATIGIQNGTKDDGLMVVYNDTYVHEGLAIEFSTGSSWLSASPESGVVAPGECVEIAVLMDAEALAAGDHMGSINIASNDLTDPYVEVPVLFHVGTVDAVEADADPNTLNVASAGKFMTVYVELPPEYDPVDVLVETVKLNGVVPAELHPFSNSEDFNGNGIPDLMFKFDRTAVAAILPEGESVAVVVTGEIEDTIYFVATNTIRVINPVMMSPNGGSTVGVGSTQVISWQNPDGWNVSHADLFWTPDDGESWYEIARDVTATTYRWTVPAMACDQARVRVFIYDNAGILGYDSSDQVFEVVSKVTGIAPTNIPMVDALAQNTPNPFNPRTTIKYDLSRDEQVNITIYDMRGRVVKVLVSEPKSAGTYEVIWDGVDKRGNRVSSGVYFYRIVAGSFQASKRMLLMK